MVLRPVSNSDFVFKQSEPCKDIYWEHEYEKGKV